MNKFIPYESVMISLVEKAFRQLKLKAGYTHAKLFCRFFLQRVPLQTAVRRIRAKNEDYVAAFGQQKFQKRIMPKFDHFK